MPPRVLLIGDADHHELCGAVHWLRSHVRLQVFAELAQALAAVKSSSVDPDVIVLAQARPGVFSDRDIQRLHQAAPLSRLVGLLGSWCEGETRSGSPWAGVTRVYWHQWLPRCYSELLHGLPAGQITWALPRTATMVEHDLYRAQLASAGQRRLIAIDAQQWVSYDGLASACQAAGYGTVWIMPHRPPALQGVDLILVDAGIYEPSFQQTLQRLVRIPGGAPLIALLDFPRLQDCAALKAAGVSSVLAKPLLLTDLWAEIERVLDSVAQGRSAA